MPYTRCVSWFSGIPVKDLCALIPALVPAAGSRITGDFPGLHRERRGPLMLPTRYWLVVPASIASACRGQKALGLNAKLRLVWKQLCSEPDGLQVSLGNFCCISLPYCLSGPFNLLFGRPSSQMLGPTVCPRDSNPFITFSTRKLCNSLPFPHKASSHLKENWDRAVSNRPQ